jgi:hypothetical protein
MKETFMMIRSAFIVPALVCGLVSVAGFAQAQSNPIPIPGSSPAPLPIPTPQPIPQPGTPGLPPPTGQMPTPTPTAAPGGATDPAGPIKATFATAYVPAGFDSNDNVQIVAEGTFPESCYRVDDPTVKVDQATKTISIEANGTKIDGYCFMYPTAFDQVINLGRINVGDYKIESPDGAVKYNALRVTEATTTSVDNYVYAHVSQAYVRNANGINTVVVEGDVDTSCLKSVELKVSSEQNVVVVLPVLIKTRNTCTGQIAPFSVTADLDSALKGRYLIHVRAQSGNSVNNVVELK